MTLLVRRLSTFCGGMYQHGAVQKAPVSCAFNIFSRALSTSRKPPHIEGPEKLQLSKPHSVVLPLGSQKVYVPSARLAQVWNEKMELIKEFLMLRPKDKEIRLLELSISKFYRTQNVPTPEVKSREDLEQIHGFITDCMKKVGETSITVQKQDDLIGGTDWVKSITASVSKFFALNDFNAAVRVQSVTEYYWNFELKGDYLFPFIDEREDLHTMVQMGLPYLDETTLYHEVGSGSGEGLIEVLSRGYSSDRMPGSIVGTDINPYSLESTKLLIEEEFGGIDNIYLRYGNAADSLDDVQLGFTPKVVVVGANRFFSILDPRVFNSVVKSFYQQMTDRGVLISGVTENSPRNIHQLEQLMLKRHPDRYELEEFELGRVLYLNDPFRSQMETEDYNEQLLIDDIHKLSGLPKREIDISRVVRQVYYDLDKFKEKVEIEGFEAVESQPVLQAMHEERQVVLFRKK